MELWGKLGRANLNLDAYKGYSQTPECEDQRKEALRGGFKMETALDRVEQGSNVCNTESGDDLDEEMESFDEDDDNDDGDPDPDNDVVEFVVEFTDEGTQHTDAAEGRDGENNTTTNHRPTALPLYPLTAASDVDISNATKRIIQMRHDWKARYARRRDMRKLGDKASGIEGKATVDAVDSAEAYEQLATEALKSGPQSSPFELLMQLECHERLFQLYVAGKLQPTMLSFYLEEMREYRWSLLDWFGSPLAPQSHRGKTTTPPLVPQRLNKIPTGRQILGDKGFDGLDRCFPNLNAVRTPLLLRNRTVKQYQSSEVYGMTGNRILCRLRYTSEVAFARATSCDSLDGVIKYANIEVLQHLHSWGHAMMNLAAPLRLPAKLDTEYQ